MSLKGTAMTNKVLRGKIKDLHQIEDVEALYAEAEKLIEPMEEAVETVYRVAKEAEDTLSAVNSTLQNQAASIVAFKKEVREELANKHIFEDQETHEKYKLYVSGGKLMMEKESE